MELHPKQRVRIQQSIHARDGDWNSAVTEGEVVSFLARPTGSWFAHGKGDKLWLRRLRLRRDDGELVDFNVDQDTQITVLSTPGT